ncbi:hypothetical protein ABT127_27715 [Streptomyces sp. NPDC001904]|uniref:hypothetical protein n=1 Tax=Streptomyces sp. NPDC001904 TaxID=3154531 RepID=UPI003323692D
MIDPLFYDQTDQTDRMDQTDQMDQMDRVDQADLMGRADRMARADRAAQVAHRTSTFDDAWCPGMKYRRSKRADAGIPLGWFPAVVRLSVLPGMLRTWR